VQNFAKIMDVEFTASMENQLDLIEEGKLNRIDTLKEFYTPFEKDLKTPPRRCATSRRNSSPPTRSATSAGPPW
jgi:DNA topoisomerase-1